MSHYHYTDQVHDEPRIMTVCFIHSFINLSMVALYRSPCLSVPISNSEFIVVFFYEYCYYALSASGLKVHEVEHIYIPTRR